jgi:hypothetical protein
MFTGKYRKDIYVLICIHATLIRSFIALGQNVGTLQLRGSHSSEGANRERMFFLNQPFLRVDNILLCLLV